jgi:hypothetical protein
MISKGTYLCGMKKIRVIFAVSIFLIACSQASNNSQALQMRIDSLQAILNASYKPGLGEFMSNIQVHHDKLWFAGQKQNWKLADFEINEIKESLDDIQKYCQDRVETKLIGMINAPIDSISKSIQEKNPASFRNAFAVLTNTCNSCHQATAHEFNVIKIPDTPPFSNQSFEVKTAK